MTKTDLKAISKYVFLFSFGGQVYYILELLWRGWSHWTMFILGGMCFIAMGLINELLSWKTPLIYQMLLGGLITTVLEFVCGLIVNICLKWNIWDYSNVPYNLLGQISLRTSLLWCGLSVIGIFMDDWIRYLFFGEEKPKYKLF